MSRENVGVRIALTGLVFSNLILALILALQLRVQPSDVLNEVKYQGSVLLDRTSETQNEIELLKLELINQKQWLSTTDGQVSLLAAEALKKKQFIEWSDEARKINPDLKIPQLK